MQAYYKKQKELYRATCDEVEEESERQQQEIRQLKEQIEQLSRQCMLTFCDCSLSLWHGTFYETFCAKGVWSVKKCSFSFRMPIIATAVYCSFPAKSSCGVEELKKELSELKQENRDLRLKNVSLKTELQLATDPLKRR